MGRTTVVGPVVLELLWEADDGDAVVGEGTLG